MKSSIIGTVCLVALCSAAQALSTDRGPIIWNSEENEVAVIRGTTMRDGKEFVVIQPTQKFLDLGRYIVVMPAAALSPRAKGGWYTTITKDEMPYLPPVHPTYFQPSGI